MLFRRSTVVGRIFFSTHVVTPLLKCILVLNQPHMRILRRRRGAMRAGEHDTPPDRGVRVHTQSLCGGCILMRRLPGYMVRLLVTGPPPLRASLHARMRGARPPRARQVVAGMTHMKGLLSLPFPIRSADLRRGLNSLYRIRSGGEHSWHASLLQR